MTLAVIIPNYNNERFLKKCLDSVLYQTFLPNEIIVVDDCSTDASVEIIKEYVARYPQVIGIYLTKNKGVSYARNIGLKAARSEYVTTLDADDFYYNESKLEKEMKLIEIKGDALSYSKIVYVDENDEVIRHFNYPKHYYLQGDIFNKLLIGYRENTIPRDYCFPKKTLQKSGMYNENSNLFEDLDLLIKISRFIPCYCTLEYGTAYRIKSYGLSKRSALDINNSRKEVFFNNCSKLNCFHRSYITLAHLIIQIQKKAKCIVKLLLCKNMNKRN